jgi:hypothetical protein
MADTPAQALDGYAKVRYVNKTSGASEIGYMDCKQNGIKISDGAKYPRVILFEGAWEDVGVVIDAPVVPDEPVTPDVPTVPVVPGTGNVLERIAVALEKIASKL